MSIDEVIERCKRGDRDAFAHIYLAYSHSMRALIGQYVTDSDAVYDILHDGFIVAFTQIKGLKDNTKIKSWLTTIMRNMALQYLRREQSLESTETTFSSEFEEIETEQGHHDLSMAEILSIIERLPAGYKNVFRLHVLDGLSHKEIGQLLGIAPNSSSSQLFHAKNLLRSLIIQYRQEIGITSILLLAGCLWHLLLNHDNSSSNLISQQRSNSTNSFNHKTTHLSKNQLIGVSINKQLLSSANSKQNNPNIENNSIASEIDNSSDLAPSAESEISTSLYSTADSIISEESKILPKEKHKITSTYNPDYDRWPNSTTKDNQWAISSALIGQDAISFSSNRNDFCYSPIPDKDFNAPDGTFTDVKTYVPIRIGFNLSKKISPKINLESGLNYALFREDLHNRNKKKYSQTKKREHFLCIPLRINYEFVSTRHFMLYTQAGTMINLPINATSTTSYFNSSDELIDKKRVNYNLSPQVSIGAGIGLQYKITSNFGIYCEPSIWHNLNSSGAINSSIQDNASFDLSIPLGFRFSW